jgi:hypothetical protein
LINHQGQEGPIQSHRREQVLVQCPVPFAIIKLREATGWRGRSTDDMHKDVEAAELLSHGVGDCRAAFCRGNVRRNEFGFADLFGTFARRRKHPRARFTERGHHCCAHPFRAAGHQRALAFQFEVVAHDRISNERIFPSASTKLKLTVMGLPGKLPASLALRTLLPPHSTISSGGNGVAIFFFRGGHPILYRRNALKDLPFVADDCIRCEAVRHRFERARVFNPNVVRNRIWKLNRHRLSFVRVVRLDRSDGLDCVDKKMSLDLRNGKNPQKSKVLTCE